MSIDWSVWIEPSYFSVRQLIDRTEEVLATLLGSRHSLTRPDGGDAPCGSAIDPVVVAYADEAEDGKVLVRFTRHAESIDDPEYGDWLFAEPSRTPRSYVLAIAVAVAAAMLAGQYVIDDPPLLGDAREREPQDVLAQLAAPTAGLPLTDAVDAVLAKTKLAARPGAA